MRLDLRAQLALQVAFGVASVVIMVLLLRAYVVQEEIDRTARGRLAVGQVLANYVDAQLSDQLRSLARASARLQQTAPGQTTLLLEDLRSRLTTTTYGVFILDASGAVIASDPPTAGADGVAVVQRTEVAAALAQGRAAVSGVHAGPGGRAQFALVVPARMQPGGPAGAIGALVDPTDPRFAELVDASLALGGGTSVEVVDQFGVVVASTYRERTLLAGQFPELYLPRLASRETGAARAFPSTGPGEANPYLVVFVPLENAPWGLALGGPESEVLAPIRRWDPPLVVLALVALVVLVTLAWLTARSVIDPVRALIASARRIARGDLSTEVPRRGGGELQQLALALDEMRRELDTAARARDEVDRLKDEFISSVSHELRTPLGYVKGYTTTLLRRDTKWDERTVRRFLKIIDESSDQLLELVDHLLDMSRISEGALRVSAAPVDLAPIAREVAQRSAVRSSAHRIISDISDTLPIVMADHARVAQVLGNLVDNAMKYSPEGGPIRIGAEQEGDHVVVSVEDEGIGIPEADLGRVFDRFHRGNHPLTRSVRGAGLGLPICRGIVEAHGGSIWAERGPERGTIVRLTLPLAPEGLAPTPDPQSPRRAPRRRRARVGAVDAPARPGEDEA